MQKILASKESGTYLQRWMKTLIGGQIGVRGVHYVNADRLPAAASALNLTTLTDAGQTRVCKTMKLQIKSRRMLIRYVSNVPILRIVIMNSLN